MLAKWPDYAGLLGFRNASHGASVIFSIMCEEGAELGVASGCLTIGCGFLQRALA